MIEKLNKILMKLGLKAKDLPTYLECVDDIVKVVIDGDYTVTVVEDEVSGYRLIGWNNNVCSHIGAFIWPKSNEKDTLEEIDKYVKAIMSTMKGE